MLFRWNLLVPRAKVLKYLSVNTEIYRDVEYVTECTSCARVTKAPLCKECRKPLLKCSLCRLPVKGLANACLNCGHGGHTLHMKVWFSVNIHEIKLTVLCLSKFNLWFFRFRKMNIVQQAVAALVYLMLSNNGCWRSPHLRSLWNLDSENLLTDTALENLPLSKLSNWGSSSSSFYRLN